jgi:hypothetical protein
MTSSARRGFGFFVELRSCAGMIPHSASVDRSSLAFAWLAVRPEVPAVQPPQPAVR